LPRRVAFVECGGASRLVMQLGKHFLDARQLTLQAVLKNSHCDPGPGQLLAILVVPRALLLTRGQELRQRGICAALLELGGSLRPYIRTTHEFSCLHTY